MSVHVSDTPFIRFPHDVLCPRTQKNSLKIESQSRISNANPFNLFHWGLKVNDMTGDSKAQ